MNTETRTQLLAEFPAARWVKNNIRELSCEGWFVLEVSPTPPYSDISKVTADLAKSELIYIDYNNGKLHHSVNCEQTKHPLDSQVRKALKSVTEETFTVAIYPDYIPELKGQPVAIPLEPEITYEKYPDHPHLNVPIVLKNQFFLPETLCYTDDPIGLGVNEYERFLTAFKEISTWLFRHQIWVALRKTIRPGIWIGPSSESLPATAYPGLLNPTGLCHCGKNEKYAFCHMAEDLALSGLDAHIISEITKNVLNNSYSWQQNIKVPRDKSLSLLRHSLL